MKSIIIYLLAASSLFASYEQAQEYYKNAKYEDVIQESKSSKEDFANSNLHFIWAKSEEALGHTSQAMSAYERVVILDSSNLNAQLALLGIYKKTGREELARESIKKLQTYTLSLSQKDILEKLTSHNKSGVVTMALSFSTGYDSNINISATGTVLDDYGIKGGALATRFAQLDASMSYIYDFDDIDGLYVKNKAQMYYQDNSDAHYYDILSVGVEAAMGYKKAGYDFSIPISYDRLRYLGVNLLEQKMIKPEIDINLDDNLLLNLSIGYASREYLDVSYKSVGDKSYKFGADIYYLSSPNYIIFHFDYENFIATYVKHPKYIDRNQVTFAISSKYRLKSWLDVQLSYNYRASKYKDTIFTINKTDIDKKRVDTNHQVDLKLSHSFLHNYEAYFLAQYINNTSTNRFSSYSKNVLMFGASARY